MRAHTLWPQPPNLMSLWLPWIQWRQAWPDAGLTELPAMVAPQGSATQLSSLSFLQPLGDGFPLACGETAPPVQAGGAGFAFPKTERPAKILADE